MTTHSGLGEERVQGLSTCFVYFVLGSEEHSALAGKGINRLVEFVPHAILSIELVKEDGVADVQFVRGDANNRTYVSVAKE